MKDDNKPNRKNIIAIVNNNSNFQTKNLFILGFFYFGQGYSLASLALLLPLYIIHELQVSSYSKSVGISAIIISPWYFKIIFGILSDNIPIKKQRRRPYLIIATIFSLSGWTTLGMHTSANILFIISGILLAIGSAMADSVIDGQTVEITPFNYIARVQGVAWGSRGLGIGLTGIASSQLVYQFGWQRMFNVSAFFGVSISLIALLLPQLTFDKINYDKSKRKQVILSIKLIFNNKNSLYQLIFFFLSGMALSIMPLLTIIMEREFAYNISIIGYGALTFAVGSFVGASINGIIFDKKETQNRVVKLFSIYIVSIWLWLFSIFLVVIIFQFVLFFIIGITAGSYEAYQLKIIQECSPKYVEGTAFALFTGVSNIGQFLFGGFVIIYLAELFHISIFIPLQIISVIALIAFFPLKKIKFP